MRSIDYRQYLDKVFGCWMGKCVAGTIGAPYEGAKELFDFEYNPSIIENMLPNDDLDLQVLWLSVLETQGIHFTSDDLAEAFLTRCRYAPGEYAIFKKNYSRGVHPPVSGAFNNRYYIQGMGCPIRSEIWGCIAVGNPRLAADLAAKDGVLDHAGNSVYAEQFLSALEAAAFFEKDLDKLVDIGLSVIPPDSRTARLIIDTRKWCKASDDWRYVRSRVIRHYGHPDCTNMFQNIGIMLLSLYFGEGDFLKTVMTALNCGFDTDCTCATAGAILGIIEGAEAMMSKYGFVDQGFVLGVDAPRRSDRVLHLAEDTCRMGIYFANAVTAGAVPCVGAGFEIPPQQEAPPQRETVRVENAPTPPVIVPPAVPPVLISVDYDGIPAIGIGDTRHVSIAFGNTTSNAITGTASLDIPEGWLVDAPSTTVGLAASETASWDVAISVPGDIEVLQETNFLTASFTINGGETITYRFGLIGAAVWQVFGPFWQNRVDMPHLELGEKYYAHIPGSNDDEYADNGRAYHLNTSVDIGREYMTHPPLGRDLKSRPSGECNGNPETHQPDAAREGLLVNCYEDRISVNDLVGFQGPCAVYMVRRLICPEERTLGIQIGHTDAYKLWINGNLVSERDNVDWWTAENAHIHKFLLAKGENTIVARLVRRSDKADFSLIFCKAGSCSPHYTDFASRNPNHR